MAEDLQITSITKEEKYKEIIPQIKALVEGELDLIANLANVTAALKQTFDFFWVGFYMVKNDELVLGPFQGPIACTRIKKGKGVCGHVFETKKTALVPDVDAFPGHIACSSLSNSEIVIPIWKNDEIWGVLDIDSIDYDEFNESDKLNLEHFTNILSNYL